MKKHLWHLCVVLQVPIEVSMLTNYSCTHLHSHSAVSSHSGRSQLTRPQAHVANVSRCQAWVGNALLETLRQRAPIKNDWRAPETSNSEYLYPFPIEWITCSNIAARLSKAAVQFIVPVTPAWLHSSQVVCCYCVQCAAGDADCSCMKYYPVTCSVIHRTCSYIIRRHSDIWAESSVNFGCEALNVLSLFL